MKFLFATAFLILIQASSTDLFFRDLKAVSPNGFFIAEAKSPDNAAGNRSQAFQDDFVVTLRTGDKPIWSWKQEEYGPTPSRLYPSDTGYLIMQSRGAFHSFSTKGKMTTFDFLEKLSAIERKKYVILSTAGPMWLHYSRIGYYEYKKKLYFHVSLYWGRNFIIDVEKSKLTEDMEVHNSLKKKFRDEALKALKEVKGKELIKCECGLSHLNEKISSQILYLKDSDDPAVRKLFITAMKWQDNCSNFSANSISYCLKSLLIK